MYSDTRRDAPNRMRWKYAYSVSPCTSIRSSSPRSFFASKSTRFCFASLRSWLLSLSNSSLIVIGVPSSVDRKPSSTSKFALSRSRRFNAQSKLI